MPRTQLGAVLEFIRATLTAQGPGDRTDADLLERFVAQREEAAFTALLQRHGPLVLSVCRRVLSNSEDVDDAFQATFLVLVRKAGSIRKSGSVASWLHGVAHRVSLEARTRTARRRAHEKRAENMRQANPADDAAARELRSILDEELEQLPQKYRDPLILHYLVGKTKEATAQQLGWSEGTVSGRLARARDLLRDRLARRGVVLSAGALSAALSQEAAVASVSSILASSTVSLATLFAAGDVAASASTAQILALTESVVHTMFLTKLKVAMAVLLLATTVGLGGSGLVLWTQAKQPPDAQEQAVQGNLPPAKKTPPEQVNDAEDKAALAITNLGGRIVRDEKAAEKPVIEVNFTHAFATDAALKELAAFKQLQTLNLCYPPPAAGGLIPVTDVGLKELKDLRSLKSLNLRRTRVTDKGLKELKDLNNLQSLNLRETLVTEAGLNELKGLQNLQVLDLGDNPRISGAGLKDFKSLRTLDLDSSHATEFRMTDLLLLLAGEGARGSGVTDAGLKGLAGLKDLQMLNLGGARVTDAGLAELRELRSLQSLDLRDTQITDAGLKELKGLTNLKLLILVRTKVTDAGMKELKELKSLESVNLWGSQVTDAGLKELNSLQGLLAVAPGGQAVALGADGAATQAARRNLKEIQSIEALHLMGHRDYVTDAWLKQVKAFKNLRTLNLDNVAVTEVGFAELKGLQGLQSLSLHRATKVTDAAMKHLKELKNLQSLDLSFSGWQNDTSVNPGSLRHPLGRTDPGTLNVTDAGVKDLKELKNLQTLNLEGTQVTDACIADLKEFKSLRSLNFGLCHKITPAGEKELKAALPQLQITITHPRAKTK